jgi:dTDP-4-dehydrorhamnose 3,5-epimerase
MKKIDTALAGAFVLEPRVFSDDRGFFLESYNGQAMKAVGISYEFMQDNHSYSTRNVIRGLHYQIGHPQGKLVRVVSGEILDVIVDLRRRSATLGKWESLTLSGENKRMLWIPPGFAHGFRVVSADAHVLYKATDFYSPQDERTLSWKDSDVRVNWELDGEPVISAKDQQGWALRDCDLFD